MKLSMDGIDGVDAFVRVVAITLLVCVALALLIPTVVTIRAARAARANAPRPWLGFMLTLSGMVSAEIFAVVTFLAVRDETDSYWAIVVFGAASVATFIGLRAARVDSAR